MAVAGAMAHMAMGVDSRREYGARIDRVFEYMDRHLDRPLELDELAGVANFSPYHFHRLFTAWTGETVGEYLRRRRLEFAAVRLAGEPDTAVLDIALSVGFGSAEAFARAFKTRFAMTLTEWRQSEAGRRKAGQSNRNPNQPDRNANQARTEPFANHGLMTQEGSMNVKLVERAATPVVYLRHVGPYGAPIARFWQDTVYPWMVTNDLLGRTRYGISHDDPGVTAPEKCRYDAAVEVPVDWTGFGRHLKTTIPGGKYAAMRFEGRVDEIGDAWTRLLRDWLPSSGMQLDARPFLEHYPAASRYDPSTGVFDCELCIPVAGL